MIVYFIMGFSLPRCPAIALLTIVVTDMPHNLTDQWLVEVNVEV
jgi:hypothetical protein